MKSAKLTPVTGIEYYSLLMKRFARLVVKDEEMAEWVVLKVLQNQAHITNLTSPAYTKRTLKQDILLHCFYYQQAQIFDRPPIKARIKTFH